MALTKATFSMIAGAPINVDDYIPPGTNTAPTDCAAFIQAAIDAANAAGGRGVVFSTKTYRTESTIQVKAHSTIIDGRNCELDYYGPNIAFDFVPYGFV
jgi:polygalacturonase